MPGLSIWQARSDGWQVTLRCERRRAGLKSTPACPLPQQLDLHTLIAMLGPDVRLEDLRRYVRCPSCGSDRFSLAFVTPPAAGTADAKPLPRRMRAVKSGPTPTLATSDDEWICFECPKCGRRGEYRRENLLRDFDGDTLMPSFLAVFAAAKGCALAKPHPTQYDLARDRECKIRYVVKGA